MSRCSGPAPLRWRDCGRDFRSVASSGSADHGEPQGRPMPTYRRHQGPIPPPPVREYVVSVDLVACCGREIGRGRGPWDGVMPCVTAGMRKRTTSRGDDSPSGARDGDVRRLTTSPSSKGRPALRRTPFVEPRVISRSGRTLTAGSSRRRPQLRARQSGSAGARMTP